MQYITPDGERQEVVPETLNVLHDVTRNGRAAPWHKHKAAASLLAIPLSWSHPDQAARMANCAERLTFTRDWSDTDRPGRVHLVHAWFCRVRICPMCQWRRSLKMYGQAKEIIRYLDAQRSAHGHAPYKWAFITLSIKNVPGAGLAAALDQIQAGWQRLIRRARVKKVAKGYIKSVEITYNRQRDDYHPHLHIMIAVNPSYFTGRDYIPHAEWRQLWQESARLNYAPQVNVKRKKGDNADLAEVTKYMTKASDYLIPYDLDTMADVTGILQDVCAKRRFASFGGCCADAHRALMLDDPEEGDLIHTSTDPTEFGDASEDDPEWVWSWCPGPRLYICPRPEPER